MYYDSTTIELGYETQPPRDLKDDRDDGTRTDHDRVFFIVLVIACTLFLIATVFIKPAGVFELVATWSLRLCLGAVVAVCIWILHDWEAR